MKKLLLIGLAFATYVIHADFVHISKWDRQLQNGTTQSVLFLGDIHDQEQIGFDQAKQTVDFVAKRNNKNDIILVEDMNDAHDLAQRLDAFFDTSKHDQDRFDQDRQSAAESIKRLIDIYEDERNIQVEKQINATLFVLPHFARNKNLNIENVEFRQFLSCDAPRLDITKYHNGHLIIPTMLENVCAEIAAFDDTPTLNAYYAQVLKRYKPFMQMICNIMREHKIIFQDLPNYFAHALMKNPLMYELKQFKAASIPAFNFYHEQLGKALSFLRPTNAERTYEKLTSIFVDLFDLSSVELVDTIIMHELYQKQIATSRDNMVCICVGEAHMLAIEKQLSQFGYNKVDVCFDRQGVDVGAFCAKHISTKIGQVDAIQEQPSVHSVWARIVAALAYMMSFVGL